jgi:tetratricopeptide (TPR) repeat protein
MMKSRTVAMVAVVALATGFMGAQVVYAPTAAIAAEKAKQVSPKVGKPLQDAIAAVKAGKLAEGLAKAQEADKVAGKTPYETFMVNQVLAAIYAQNKDFPNAVKALEAQVSSGEMSAEDSKKTMKQVANSYYQMKNYPKVIEVAGTYVKTDPNDTDMLVLIAQSQYLQKNYKGTSDGVQATIKAARASGKPIQEGWLQLQMSAEHELGNDAGTTAALEQLIAVNPKEEYWKNLIQYAEKATRNGGNSTKTALDMYFIKMQVGTLATAQEYSDMAQLALQDGLPGAAKKIVDKGFASGVLGAGATKDREVRLQTMATTQAAADEKSLATGEAEARKAKTGDALVKAGEAYWSYGQYDKAADIINEAITKGVTSTDDAKLRLGIVLISAGKKQQAMDAFKGIAAASTPGQLSRLWILAANSPMKKA